MRSKKALFIIKSKFLNILKVDPSLTNVIIHNNHLKLFYS